MLDGLLGRGFSSKCKSLIKATRARIEVVRRRAEARQRFLKEDLAKLLANGLDINAYGRTEEFLAGSNLLASYDFIEQTCEYIRGQLSCMQKQRECPEECREAVGSLMFAAARFSDLPELRDIRDVFQERYGNSLDCYVHPKFLEKLSSKSPERERRVQLLQDIASEYSIKWDSRGFEQRMTTSSATAQAQPNKHGNSHVTSNKYDLHASIGSANKTDKLDFSFKKRLELVKGSDTTENAEVDTLFRREDKALKTNRQDVFIGQRPEFVNSVDKTHDGREGGFSRRKEPVMQLHPAGRPEASGDSYKKIGNSEETSSGDKNGILFHGKQEVTVRKHRSNNEKDPGRPETSGDSYKKIGNREENPLGDKNGFLFHAKQEVTVRKYRSDNEKDDMCGEEIKVGSSSRRKELESGDMHSSRLNNITKGESRDGLSYEKSEGILSFRGISGNGPDISTPSDHGWERSARKIKEEEADKLNFHQNRAIPPPYVKSKDSFLPPPYTKPRDGKHRNSKGSDHANVSCNGPPVEPSPGKSVHAFDHSDGIHIEVKHSTHQRQSSEPPPVNNFGPDHIVQNQGSMIPLPKPRSMRRKHHKPSSHQSEVSQFEDSRGTRSSRSRRRENPKKGLQILFDDEHRPKDEEERMMDKLLLHYSKKPSDYDFRKLRKKPHAGESSHDQSRDGDGGEPDYIPPPTRSISLPHEQTVPSKDVKVYTRANSFQPDNQARHVHPKLPDYDDLAARFAALKGDKF